MAANILTAEPFSFDNAHDIRGTELAPMDLNATPANRFNELPSETQEFLSQLREEDIELLRDGLELVRSTRTIGRFMRWLILGFLAVVVGTVTAYENILKFLAWFHPGK